MVSEATTVVTEYRAHLFGARKDRQNKYTVLTGGQIKEEVKGIFETKERLTSELVTPLVQDYRTLRCRLLAVCRVLSDSIQAKVQSVPVDILGCVPASSPIYPECNFASTLNQEPFQYGSFADAAVIQGECQRLLMDTLAVERSVLKAAVAYDAGYRSTLQFAGMMDWMLEDLTADAIKPLQDMVNLLGKLHQIPCFIGQCDAPDTPLVNIKP